MPVVDKMRRPTNRATRSNPVPMLVGIFLLVAVIGASAYVLTQYVSPMEPTAPSNPPTGATSTLAPRSTQ